jgi:UDP-glucose 4-epimerase
MRKVLVTGSSGYIGSHLCKLLENNYEVHGLDIQQPLVPLKKFYEIDINKQIVIDESYDAVIHLAALVNVSKSQRMPIMYYITNINGTMNVLNKIKTKNFIFASTGAAEGCASAYGVSKRAAEDVVREFCTVHKPDIDYTIFRFYNVIGSHWSIPPTNPDGLMYNLLDAMSTKEFTIYGKDYQTPDGTCIRDYVHVLEICHALEQAIENPSKSIECLGHGVGYTVKEIANKFQEVNNVDFDIKYGPRRDGDLPSSVLEDVSPYMKNLYSFEELLKVT